MARIDYNEASRTYDRARGLELDALDGWRRAVAPWLPAGQPARILDLGAGTGQWALAFATWFDAAIVAVEPSAGMRAEGRVKTRGLPVEYVGGAGERLPIREQTCDLAWLSTVIHHIPDLDACARDLRRVVRPGGAALIRSAFPGRTDRITLFRYFPEAARVVDSFPSVERTRVSFEGAGFGFEALQPVPQVSARDLAAYRARVQHRSADTVLRLMDDDVYARGVARIEADIAAGVEGPLVDELDMMVFR
ncbi:MAG: methyltransferase domain-containing protein [Dehalococcoidia bacterium]